MNIVCEWMNTQSQVLEDQMAVELIRYKPNGQVGRIGLEGSASGPNLIGLTSRLVHVRVIMIFGC